MTRFDERRTIDHLAEAGPLDPALVDATAEAIAASHRSAPLAAADPWIHSIPGIIEGNTAAFREAACFPAEDIDDLRQASLSAFSRLRELLEQRGRQGYVRRCHGDLHLANIVLIDGQPVLFDAIEFDPVIASVDVLYDLAFTIMDFIRYDRPAAANALLNRYLGMTPVENLDALAALPLFMSLRSAIRAHVLLARIDRNSRETAEVMRSSRAYFELAQRTIRPAGADAGGCRRTVRNRKVGAGARARPRRAAPARRRRVAHGRAAQAAISRSGKRIGFRKMPTGRR